LTGLDPGMDVRVGERFVLGFTGTTIPAWLAQFEHEHGLGGVVLFDRDLLNGARPSNIESPVQLTSLCRAIHALPSRPLVFIDQEGGLVRRLQPERGFRELPSAEALARLPHAEARAVVAASVEEMKGLGIDFDLAPVVDLNSNPENPNIGRVGRSFSADPNEVRRCVALFDEAARRVGLGLCLKHYPGLGGAVTDSHQDRTELTVRLSELELFTELCPVTSGSTILLSHGFVRAWDPLWPVSLSAHAVNPLRSAVSNGLFITDDLQMGGLRHLGSTVDVSLRALEAGVDMVCIGNQLVVEEEACMTAARLAREQVKSHVKWQATCRASQERVAARKAAFAV